MTLDITFLLNHYIQRWTQRASSSDCSNHRRSMGAKEKDDQWRVSKGKRHKKQTLTGCELEVEWADSTTSLPLQELKEMNHR